MLSAVIIIPVAHRAAANALGEAMGWGPDNYSVPLSATGKLPASHYGLRAWVTEEFVRMLDAPTAPDGYPAKDFAGAMSALMVSIQPGAEGHFAEFIKENGLQLANAGDAV
jgi:hypothetical protein